MSKTWNLKLDATSPWVLFDIERVLVACRWLVYGERVVKVDENRANHATARAKQYVMSRESM